MKFIKIEDDVSAINLECNELGNNLLFRKYNVKENDIILLKEKEFLILTRKGQVLDVENEIGKYKIQNGKSNKKVFLQDWQDVNIKKSEDEPLNVIFLNTRTIIKNKFFIEEPIKYIEYNKDGEKVYYLKINGNFDFKIVNPKAFLKRVIGLRSSFPKQELIEQIRNYILQYIEYEINIISKDYKLKLDNIETKIRDLKIDFRKNKFVDKLLEYGIRLIDFDIDNLEIVDNKFRKFF